MQLFYAYDEENDIVKLRFNHKWYRETVYCDEFMPVDDKLISLSCDANMILVLDNKDSKMVLKYIKEHNEIQNNIRAAIEDIANVGYCILEKSMGTYYEAGWKIVNLFQDKIYNNKHIFKAKDNIEDVKYISINERYKESIKSLSEWYQNQKEIEWSIEVQLQKLANNFYCVYNKTVEFLLKQFGIKHTVKLLKGLKSKFKQILEKTKNKIKGRLEKWQLQQMQGLPLELKVRKTLLRIREWYEYYEGKVYVSFSGGIDSTLLLHLVRSLYPEVAAVYVDTGLEYPEIKSFVKSIPNVIWLKPKKSFVGVLKKYGYPVISKETSLKIRKLTTQNLTPEYRNYLLNGDERGSIGKLADKWKPLLNADFRISNECCNVMKKAPAHLFEKKTGMHPFTGEIAEESKNRESQYLQHGCNAFNSDNPKSTPLGFWTHNHVLQYIKENNIPYSKIYGDIIEKDDVYTTTGEKRTGCIYCLYGIQMEKGENRLQRLAKIHPELYKFGVSGGMYDRSGKWIPANGLGLRKILDFIKVPYKVPGIEINENTNRITLKYNETKKVNCKKIGNNYQMMMAI